MENYLMLNGKRIDLTSEQIETLVGKKEKDPFERGAKGESYWFITSWDGIERVIDGCELITDKRYENANYCTDKELMKQRALHETLNRLLWRYSMQHGGEKMPEDRACMYYSRHTETYETASHCSARVAGVVYFINEETARAAIEEIVKPFMEQHPEFRW